MKKTKGLSLIVLLIICTILIGVSTVFIVRFAKEYVIDDANSTALRQVFSIYKQELSVFINDRYTDSLGSFDQKSLNADRNSVTYNTKTAQDTERNVYDILKSLRNSEYANNVTIKNGVINLKGLDKNTRKAALEAIENAVVLYEKATVDNIVTIYNATINGNNPSYYNPVIPEGFMPINTINANWTDSDNDGTVDDWNKGLVISDIDGNEFVWIPVDGKSVIYKKNSNYPSDTSKEFEYPANVKDENVIDDYDEKAQINKYGGFYIGRYEAGVSVLDILNSTTNDENLNKEGLPQSKPGIKVWSNISYTKAKENAKSFIDEDHIKSGLPTARMWDTICLWISNNRTNVTSDSTRWGNYNDASKTGIGYGDIQETGFSEYWVEKNIYDFAGNTWEWTSESFASKYFCRGGSFNVSGKDYPASYRKLESGSSTKDDLSYRIALYIM